MTELSRFQGDSHGSEGEACLGALDPSEFSTEQETNVSEEAYRHHEKAAGGYCPIEAGLLGSLADNECKHGRLSGDRTAPCGCWPLEAPPVIMGPILVPTRTEQLRRRRQQVVALYETGAPVALIAVELGVPYARVVHDVQLLQQQGVLDRRYREKVAA